MRCTVEHQYELGWLRYEGERHELKGDELSKRRKRTEGAYRKEVSLDSFSRVPKTKDGLG